MGGYALHHCLGSFLQTEGEAVRSVRWVSEETLSIYAAQLSLHFLAQRDKTETKHMHKILEWDLKATLVMRLFGQQGVAEDLLFG